MFLQVCAGLANRLRATVSGICAAEDLGVPLVISWPWEVTCAATFKDLFEPVPKIEISEMHNYRARMCLSPADWEREKTHSEIIIKSYGQFHQSDPERWLRTLRSLKPREEFLGPVKKLIVGNVVGVHIRRTDNKVSCEKSPTAAFIAEMKKYPSDIRFFIATDDTKEWYTLLNTFSAARLIRATTNSSRDTSDGMCDAFIDFLCLAACKEILGSAGSSFSEMAAAYGGRPLRISLST
jgi:hypothetical protein